MNHVSMYSLSQIIKICQQFVKYEPVMDTFMSPWRRTGSPQSQQFFQSNRDAIVSNPQTDILQALARCDSIHTLADLMNPNGDRYFKLNLQNLVTGRQPTLEFRQHASTSSYDQIASWVRFFTRFSHNAANLRAPQGFAATTPLDTQWDALFWYVIKD